MFHEPIIGPRATWRDDFDGDETVTLDNLEPLLDLLADKVAERVAQRLERPADVPLSDRLLDVHKAAELLGVTERWLYRRAKKPGLPFARRLSDGVLRFSEHGILAYMAGGKRVA